MRLEDLPPHLQEQALAKLGETPKAKRSRGDRAQGNRTQGWCWTCGERFLSVAAWERHVKNNEGHRRLELYMRPKGAKD